MLTSSDNKSELFLGIDGGGSKCKAIVMNKDNEILGTGISGPGNPLHGFEQATNSITESAKMALEDAGMPDTPLSDLVAGVGLAGVNLPVLFDKMAEWQHPFKQMFLATDLLIACLGAHQGNDGAVMISGTGSCGFSCIDDEEFIIGAHGFPHGDKGSGAWFGLQAAKQVLLSLDGVVSPSIMNDVLLAKLNCKDDTELVEAIAGKVATYYAQLANLVFDAAEQSDKIALGIVEEGAEYINSIARTLLAKQPPRISMIGGLTPRLKPWLAKDIQAQLAEPLSPPEVGAVLFARKTLAKQQQK
ncbi:N-acetylglucosamine kinase [Litorilituus lipolyticus]|uniref:ATPase n=1 Tax=Litorilituus lipolyticus TaxID=2491017 RepID=A0A502LAC7_9GAMM|nr:BadF/BadG/BcrA/BcrD ATPase family protein [Litorilituus lipolyticus]TPH19365.1 ATPase [Litorilituus lipolyticus]